MTNTRSAKTGAPKGAGGWARTKRDGNESLARQRRGGEGGSRVLPVRQQVGLLQCGRPGSEGRTQEGGRLCSSKLTCGKLTAPIGTAGQTARFSHHLSHRSCWPRQALPKVPSAFLGVTKTLIQKDPGQTVVPNLDHISCGKASDTQPAYNYGEHT